MVPREAYRTVVYAAAATVGTVGCAGGLANGADREGVQVSGIEDWLEFWTRTA